MWGSLAVGFVIQAFVVWQRDQGIPSSMAQRDYDAAAAALDRLPWIGYDDAGRRTAVGMGLGEAQRPKDALVQLERSIALRPTVPALAAVGDVHARQGDWADARTAFERAIALDPGTADLYAAAGKAALANGDVAGARALGESADRTLPVGSPSLESLRHELAASASERQN